MALIPTLILKDSTTFSDEVSFSVTDSLTVTAPAQSLSTAIVTTTGGNHTIITAATGIRYLFVRHTGLTGADATTASTARLDVEDEDNNTLVGISAGEFAFFPCSVAEASKAIQLQSSSGNIKVEYAYWTKG